MNSLVTDELVRQALIEDIGFGDISTQLTPNISREVSAEFVAKADGILCGCAIAGRCFELYCGAKTAFSRTDGDTLEAGVGFGTVQGPGGGILTAERVALNFLQRLSGIATQSRRLADLARPKGIRVVETRKTTPGLRMLEKYAVRMGTGFNHRLRLDDCVMLKDNHFTLHGGTPGELVRAVKAQIGHSIKIIAEAADLEMINPIVEAGADVVLLDNFSPAEVQQGVTIIDGRAMIELSGGISEDNIDTYLIDGVDVISIGALTHSYKALDISLEA